MSKVTEQTNYRIIVEPWTARWTDSKHAQRKCESILSDIKRHIDDIGHVWVEHDTEITCSYCGREWDEDPETKEPQCCNEAQEDFTSQTINKKT